MIEWLRRARPGAPFLETVDRVWTYAETVAEVEARVTNRHRVIRPALDPDSVFDILSGLAGGGVTVVGDDQDASPSEGVDLVVFTSGSSGEPKGVRLSIENLAAASSGSIAHLGHGEDDTWLLAMPLHHVGGLSILVRSAYAGGSVRMLDGFTPESFIGAMRGGVTMVSVVATMLRRLLDVDPGPYRGLRAVLVGGGPAPAGLLEEAVGAGLPVLPSYGMTETFGQIATHRPDLPVSRRAHPLPGVELRIDDEGRIQVRGAQVSSGYVGEPDRDDDWFTTSDLGEIDVDGAVRISGRADQVIITGGKKVDPARVEEAANAHPQVAEAVAYGVADTQWGEQVVCAVVGDVDESALIGWMRERLPGFMVPKEIRRVDVIPRTSIGKPDRRALASDG